MNIEVVAKRISRLESVDLVGKVPDALIARAEEILGVRFPPQYRDFLSAFGCGGVDSEQFIGLGGDDYLDIVKLSRRLREGPNPLPSRLLPLRADGFGNYECFDTSRPTEAGEFAIVEWNHEGGPDHDCRVLAESYGEWFDSVLTMIENDGDEDED